MGLNFGKFRLADLACQGGDHFGVVVILRRRCLQKFSIHYSIPSVGDKSGGARCPAKVRQESLGPVDACHAAWPDFVGKSVSASGLLVRAANSSKTGCRHFGTKFLRFQLCTVVAGMPVLSAISTKPPSRSMIWSTVIMKRQYDNRIIDASD